MMFWCFLVARENFLRKVQVSNLKRIVTFIVIIATGVVTQVTYAMFYMVITLTRKGRREQSLVLAQALVVIVEVTSLKIKDSTPIKLLLDLPTHA